MSHQMKISLQAMQRTTALLSVISRSSSMKGCLQVAASLVLIDAINYSSVFLGEPNLCTLEELFYL